MTLNRSIILSLAMHLLLFGTGLAFARYAGGLLWSHQNTVMVTLVGQDGNSPAQSSERQGRRKAAPRRASRQNPAPVTHEETLNSSETAPSSESRMVRSSRLPEETSDGTGGSSDQRQSVSRAGGSAQDAFSSEQWAVIVSSIEKVKSYPRLARQNGIEGVVRLRFRLNPSGQVDKAEIVKSSGSEILDTASIRTVYRAGPMPYVTGWVEVPIAYVLK